MKFTKDDDEKDPPICTPEWPWSLPRSVVLARYASDGGEPERGAARYAPGTIAWGKSQVDGRWHPVIFGYEEKGYLIKRNEWMITDEELAKQKLRNVERVYEIISHRSHYSPEMPLDEYDPVPIYIKEMQKLGKQPDKHMIEHLSRLWETYKKRHITPF